VSNPDDRTWIALLTATAFLLSTGALWFRFRLQTSMRPWLWRHLIGNCILAIGFFTAWFLDAPLFFYALIAVCVFGMWIWGNRRLRDAVQKNKVT